MNEEDVQWPADCHSGIEDAIAEFRKRLPNWWYSLGECQVSCDASCAPTSLSTDIERIPLDERFNSGFHADLRQPSTLAEALRTVMLEALVAKDHPGRMHLEAVIICVNPMSDKARRPLREEDLGCRFVEEVREQYGIDLADWTLVRQGFPFEDGEAEERKGVVVISVSTSVAEAMFLNNDLVEMHSLRQAEVENALS